MIANTSQEAYAKLKSALGAKQRVVYDVIKNNEPIINEKIADILGWEINRVTGRVNELVELGLVKHHSYELTKSRRRAKAWAIANPRHATEIEAKIMPKDIPLRQATIIDMRGYD